MRTKTRLTITLSPELLQRLDRAIDDQGLSNRSRGIETLLRRVLEPKVRQAVILAGGEHDGAPAPSAAPIAARPLLVHTIQHLAAAGIRSVHILAGADEAELRAVIAGASPLGADIQFIEEQGRRGTAGALKLAAPHLTDDPFLVIHGDVLTDIDVAGFVRFHLDEGSLATIAVKPRHAEPHYGQVMLEGNRITRFLATPRPDGHDEGISIVNTGVYLFQPRVLDLIASGRASQLETDVFPRLAEMGELGAFLFQGIWFDISMPENYDRASARWSEKGA